tara:strand:+ start:171 stop:848 length:678 start_codon:yes stop_codon:yes gene_type:complete
MFSLFISTCKCGNRYLAATTKTKAIGKSYFGSGVEWKEHLQNCEVVDVDILHQTKSHEEHTKKAKEFSKTFNIVDSDDWYNLQEELGVPSDARNRIGVSDWSKEEKKFWYTQKQEPKPNRTDALNYISEDEDVVVDVEEVALNKVQVDEVLSDLTDRESEVFRYHFGIGRKAISLTDIAETLNISRERVRQIEAKGLRKIRRKYGVDGKMVDLFLSSKQFWRFDR